MRFFDMNTHGGFIRNVQEVSPPIVSSGGNYKGEYVQLLYSHERGTKQDRLVHLQLTRREARELRDQLNKVLERKP